MYTISMTVESEHESYEGVLPDSIEALIEAEVEKDIAPIRDEDPDSAEFYEDVMREYRTGEYQFLKWLGTKIPSRDVLYAGSGHDVIPKVALDATTVIHTSLENYRGDRNYFTELGDGAKVVADNSQLPFTDDSFLATLLFGAQLDKIQRQFPEIDRVLGTDGLLVFNSSVLDQIDDEVATAFLTEKGYEQVDVPDEYQIDDGMSEARFYVFRKK